MKRYRPLSFRKIRTYPLSVRQSKVETGLLAAPYRKGFSFRSFIDGLPDILAAKDFKAVVRAVVAAREKGRPVVLGMGAHPIKVGLSPLIIDLMEKDVITALATNGASLVHDFELTYDGKTSEDVPHALLDGSFGMARETGKLINAAIRRGVGAGFGLGKSMGMFLEKSRFPNKGLSIFAAGAMLEKPVSVHVALGTDIIHMHPSADGAAIGEGSMRDFRLLASVVADLEGGVYLNLGSAVLLPEVFLKALAVARNLGNKVENITTVNMDFIQHYRARENVLKRPTLKKGRAYAITGHHEIMFPLLASAIMEECE
jgi:hypothetical protein